MTVSWSGPKARLAVTCGRRRAFLELAVAVEGGRWRTERLPMESDAEAARKFAELLRMLRGDWR